MIEAKNGIAGDASRVKFTESDIARFWAKVDKNGPVVRPELGPCWLWTAAPGQDGYGKFKAAGKTWRAHRVSFVATFGAILDELCVCHKCDTPLCVRPAHLFLGTSADNVADMDHKGRRNAPRGDRHFSAHLHGVMPRGEDTTWAKVSEPDVRVIRMLCSEKKLSQRKIGEIFGITQTAVSLIARRINWAHIG